MRDTEPNIYRDDKKAKEQGAEEIFNFLSELIVESDQEEVPDMLLKPREIITNLSKLSFDDFRNFIDNIHARSLQIEVDREKQVQSGGTAMKDEEGNVVMINPKPKNGETILEETYKKIKDKIKNDIGEKDFNKKGFPIDSDKKVSKHVSEEVAFSIFTAISDVHFYKNGNGRTSRALYYLLSPKAKKDKQSFYSNFENVVARKEGKGNLENINLYLRRASYIKALLERNLNPTEEKFNSFYSRIDTSEKNYEYNRVDFLAIYDVLKESDEFEVDNFLDEVDAKVNKIQIEYIKPYLDDRTPEHINTDRLKTFQTDFGVLAEIFKIYKGKDNFNIDPEFRKELSELGEKITEKAEEIRCELIRNEIDISLNYLDKDKKNEPLSLRLSEELDSTFN